MANFYNPKFENLEDLISFGENAIETATDAQIYETFIKKMKSIYGNDIDISSTVADGIWMAQLTNLFSKLFKVTQKLSQANNPNEASGKYLDICCSYNNIFRKEETYSTVYISVTYNGDSTGKAYIDGDRQYITLVDVVGNTWTWEEYKNENENFPTKFVYGQAQSLLFTCDTVGSIELKQNSVVNLLDYSNEKFKNFVVVEDAVVGTPEESDDALKNRRTLQQGNNSVSTLSGLDGALRDIYSIEDVLIYNNYKGSEETPQYGDGQQIDSHTVYVVLRYNTQTIPNKNEIANVIYNKLTPGIGTQLYEQFVASTDTSVVEGKTYYTRTGSDPNYIYTPVQNPTGNPSTSDYYESLSGEQQIKGENVYWKIAQPKCENLDLKLLVNKNFASSSDITSHVISDTNPYVQTITKNIIDYINGLSFRENLTVGGIINNINKFSTSDSDNNIIYIGVGGEFKENINTAANTKGNTKDYQNPNYDYFDYNTEVKKYYKGEVTAAYTVTYSFKEAETAPVGSNFDGYREITIEIRHS